MVDKRNGKKMNAAITGSARRQSYKFSPTSRMTNTFFINGNLLLKKLLKILNMVSSRRRWVAVVLTLLLRI